MNDLIGKWTIKKKLIAGFLFVGFLVGLVGLIGSQRLASIRQDVVGMSSEIKDAEEVAVIEADMLEQVKAEKDYILTGDSKFLEEHKNWAQEIDKGFSKVLASAEKANDKERTSEINAIKEQSDAYRATFEQVVGLVGEKKINEAINLSSSKADADAAEMTKRLQKIIDEDNKTVAAECADVVAGAKNATVFMVAAAIVAVLVALVLGLTISFRVAGQLSNLVAKAETIASGDLTVQVEVEGKDEIAQLSESFRTMVESLRSTVSQVSDTSSKVAASSQSLSATAEEVSKATQQITETVNQVATGSEEQSKAVQASAAAMEQLSRAVGEVAAGAQNQVRTVEDAVSLIQQIGAAIDQVSALSQTASANGQQVREVATAGGRQVAEAVDGMGRIKDATDQVADMVKQLGDSSQQIGAIVETINDIAEQTNLLALNAAIEAARAGEHGKGFAVVADEVRKLAERSSKATGEIGELIGNIQQMTAQAVEAMDRGSKQVEEGTQLGSQAGEALGKIQEAIAGIVAQIEDMSAAAQQMSSSSAEVIKAIENVSAITEETSAAAEEMSASSGEVTQQIEQVAALSEESAAAAEEVAATTEEQNAAVEEMSASADDLAKMAGDLQELVGQFKIDDNVTVVRSAKSTSRKPAADKELRKAA